MNDFILLGGKRYKTFFKKWTPELQRGAGEQCLVSGGAERQFGQFIDGWRGLVKAPVTPESSEYGSIADLRSLILLNQVVALRDHYDQPYNVILVGPYGEDSHLTDWESASNYFMVSFRLVKV